MNTNTSSNSLYSRKKSSLCQIMNADLDYVIPTAKAFKPYNNKIRKVSNPKILTKF